MIKWNESNVKGEDYGLFLPQYAYFDWQAIVKNTGTKAQPYLQCELRMNHSGVSGLLILASDGWNYNNEKRTQKERWSRSTKGLQARLSFNGALNFELSKFIKFQADLSYIHVEVYSYLLDLEAAVASEGLG